MCVLHVFYVHFSLDFQNVGGPTCFLSWLGVCSGVLADNFRESALGLGFSVLIAFFSVCFASVFMHISAVAPKTLVDQRTFSLRGLFQALGRQSSREYAWFGTFCSDGIFRGVCVCVRVCLHMFLCIFQPWLPKCWWANVPFSLGVCSGLWQTIFERVRLA